jgi:F-type H+-transporting ATPase subunit b
MFLLALAESAAVQLVPDGTIFIHIALILVMIFVLNRTFFRPINRIIDAREKKRGGRFGESESLLKEVADKQAQYSETIRQARSKGYEIVEKERAEALNLKQEKLGAVKTEVESTVATETAALEKQTVEAREAIAAEAEVIAEKISSNILRG